MKGLSSDWFKIFLVDLWLLTSMWVVFRTGVELPGHRSLGHVTVSPQKLHVQYGTVYVGDNVEHFWVTGHYSPKVHWSEGSLVRKVTGPNSNPNPYPNPNPNRNPIPNPKVVFDLMNKETLNSFHIAHAVMPYRNSD